MSRENNLNGGVKSESRVLIFLGREGVSEGGHDIHEQRGIYGRSDIDDFCRSQMNITFESPHV
jgi:hypothetical protein